MCTLLKNVVKPIISSHLGKEFSTILLFYENDNVRFNETIDIIISCNEILYDKIYVFQNQQDLTQLICTYNVEFIDNYEENIENTISLHRKKQSNTLYTINALNEVIRSKNNGVLDKRYNVDWNEYQNTLLLTNETGLNVVPTKIFQIINVKEWNK